MVTDDSAATVSVEMLTSLRTQIEQLTDLFKRRLLEDRSKNALIEAVQDQVRAANASLQHRDFENLFREALLAIDRLHDEPASPELAESVVDELLEVFHRRDLVQIDDGGEFDPRFHEVVATVEVFGTLAPNAIAAVHRKGYLLGDRVLRPTRVTITVGADERSA